jgi:sucrose-phosphate synthase
MRIAFINPQGNFDPKDSYWTTHPDFGGQLVYVKELAIALSRMGVNCDIITRRIDDPQWPEFSDEFDYYPGVENVRVVRIDFGPKGFLSKEALWPYLGDFKNGVLDFYRNDRTMPSFITTHYGDGGIVGAMIFKDTGIPFSFTAHSLGAQKLEKLLQSGRNRDELESEFKFSFRIAAERIAMKYSAVNFVSTSMERYQQYSHRLYKDYCNVGDDSKFAVVPPGVNTEIFNQNPTDLDKSIESRLEESCKRFLPSDRSKLPMIVVSSRLEEKKNHIGLVKAFAGDSTLKESSNLLLIVRGLEDPYEDYEGAPEPERSVLAEIIETIKKTAIEDKVVFMSIKSQRELAALYRIAAGLRSVFALTSLYEPFGLAPIEAMACGLPAVATSNGGPSESLSENGVEFGILVDPFDSADIARGLKRLIGVPSEISKGFSDRAIERVHDKYTWDSTARGYLEVIKGAMKRTYPEPEIPDYIYSGEEVPFVE